MHVLQNPLHKRMSNASDVMQLSFQNLAAPSDENFPLAVEGFHREAASGDVDSVTEKPAANSLLHLNLDVFL